MKGSVELARTEYKNLLLKIDLLANEIHFKDTKGQEMICSSPINKITLTDAANGKQYTFVYSTSIPEMEGLKPEAWMQVRAQGRASLYTQHKKSISETRPYGSATMEQRIMTNEINYLVVNNQYIRVKKLSDILGALTDKKAELQEWVKKNDIDPKNTADLARVVEAYNNLFPKS